MTDPEVRVSVRGNDLHERPANSELSALPSRCGKGRPQDLTTRQPVNTATESQQSISCW